MSDAPMSRRARRALEEQAAERMAQENLGVTDVPSAAQPGTGELPLSRRDRRRLERLQRPMETWTAEEEMIATGQIPVLTPERIAEQERLAREKAEQAARDAQLASHELRRVTQNEIAPSSEFATPEPTPVAEPEPTPVAEPEPVPVAEPEPIVEAPFAAHLPVTEPEPIADAPFTPGAGFIPAPARESAPEPIDEPFTPVFQFEPVKPPRVREEDEPAPVQPFADIFPAGSVQGGAPAEPEPEPAPESDPNPFAAFTVAAQPEPAAAQPEPATAQPEPPAAQPDPASGIDEIRRLAAEAMSGIERAGQAHAVDHSHDFPVAQPFTPGAVEPEERYDAVVSQPAPATPASGAFQQVTQPAPATPASGAFQQVTQPAPVTPTSGAFQQVNQPEPSAPHDASPWDVHPLEQAAAPLADPNDFTPIAAPVQPDFSALYEAAPQQAAPFAPVTGTSPTVPPSAALPTSGQFPTSPFGAVSPTPSGQIPTESLATGTFRRPEIPAGPGPRDFKWLHLGVIGALMFVLGVFIYNVAFNQ